MRTEQHPFNAVVDGAQEAQASESTLTPQFLAKGAL